MTLNDDPLAHPVLLRTPRCELRPISPEDLDELHALFLDREIRRYLLDDEEMPRSFTESAIADSQELFSEQGLGLWGLRQLADGHVGPLDGFVGYRHFFDPPELQLLYGLHPRAWGRGLATEAARCVIDFAFERELLDEVVAATDPPNVASVEVMQRLGLAHWKTFSRDGKETVHYRARRPG